MIDLILHYISSALDTLFLTYEVPRGGQDEKMVIWVQFKYVFFPSLSLSPDTYTHLVTWKFD